MRLTYRNTTKLISWAIPAFIFLLSITGSLSAVAKDNPFIEQVRYIVTEKLGISNPIGLAYSPRTQTFLIGQTDQSLNNHYEMVGVSLLEDFSGSQAINTDINNPANYSFDAHTNRILILNVENSREVLITIKAKDNGNFDQLERFNAKSFGLENPQGMTVDPASGTVFILDATGPRILRVEPNLDGSFHNAETVEINLSTTGLSNLQNIAFNPNDGYLYVLDTLQHHLVALSLDGQIQSTRNLSRLQISNPENMVFAPSGDLTDDASEMSLYINNNGLNGVIPGIAEFTLTPPQINQKTQEVTFQAVTNAAATMEFKVETSLFNPSSPDPSGIGYLPATNSLLISDGEVEEPPVTPETPVLFEGYNLFETDLFGNLINTTSIATQSALDLLGFSNVDTAGFSDEPTGVSEINPFNNHLFISDDDDDDIYEVDPASDGLYGTSDDIVTSFSTRNFLPSSGDPEGVAYAAQLGMLFIVDGLNSEIYSVSPGNDGLFHSTTDNVVTHFDTEQRGLRDPEGITYLPATGNLLVIGSTPRETLFELTTSGELVREIDFTVAVNNNLRKPAGLALAPPDATDPTTTCVYLVDRANDNDSVPGENDGLLFKMCFPTGDILNQPPIVDAGPNQTIIFPENVILDGTVFDDGYPTPPSAVTVAWSKLSGPGVVGFSSANTENTTASFSTPGTYILRLTADDNELQTSNDVTITVTNIGGGSTTTIENRVATGSDDAEESNKGRMKVTDDDLELVHDRGEQTVGMRFNNLAIPEAAIITKAFLQFQTDENKPKDATDLIIEGEAIANAATFSSTNFNISRRPRTAASIPWSPNRWRTKNEAGPDQQSPDISPIIQEIINSSWSNGNSMVLIITGTGKRVAESFEGKSAAAPLLHIEYVTASVTHQAPIVNAGQNQSITLSMAVTLNGTVSDDDLPTPVSLTTLWTKTSGPITGTVTFANSSAVNTTATFSEVGTYVLTLIANDSDLEGSDQITVTVNATAPINEAPTVDAGADQSIELSTAATLIGSVTDDNLPIPASLTTTWTQTNGPGTVIFTDISVVNTTANFSGAGTYLLRLTANDGEFSVSDEITITVNPTVPTNQAPEVNAGIDQIITLPASAALTGMVNDDGLPTPTLLTTWIQASGPGTVTVTDSSAVNTTVSFSEAGTYVLQLTANDSDLQGSDEITITVTDNSGGGTATLEVRVSASSDDAEENNSGSMSLTSSDLELVLDKNNQTIGLRFNDITIAPGTLITNAYLQFQVDETKANDVTDLTIEGEAVANPATFTSIAGNISIRPRTTASIQWTPDPWRISNEAGLNQRSPDISSIIQEIVTSSWSNGNAMVLIITGTGKRVAESFDGMSSAAPLLHIEFSTGPVSNQAPIVNAGPDKTIALSADANLGGTVSDDGLPSPVALTTLWSITSGPATGTVTFADATTGDTTASFSEAGTYVLQLSAHDTEFETTDEVTITVNNTSNGETATINIQISAGSDDAEESSSGKMSLTSSDIELVFDSSNQTAGMRFNGLAIPPGSIITSAYIQFQVDETAPNDATNLTIEGEAVANATTFTSTAGNISTRARTVASTQWLPNPWTISNEAGPDQQTPNISDIIQEIIDSSWSSGNSIVLIITGTGERIAESFDGKPDAAPLLHVEFILP